jgi:hypothetical protein
VIFAQHRTQSRVLAQSAQALIRKSHEIEDVLEGRGRRKSKEEKVLALLRPSPAVVRLRQESRKREKELRRCLSVETTARRLPRVPRGKQGVFRVNLPKGEVADALRSSLQEAQTAPQMAFPARRMTFPPHRMTFPVRRTTRPPHRTTRPPHRTTRPPHGMTRPPLRTSLLFRRTRLICAREALLTAQKPSHATRRLPRREESFPASLAAEMSLKLRA